MATLNPKKEHGTVTTRRKPTAKKATDNPATVPAVQITAAEDSTIIHSNVFESNVNITGDVTGAFLALADALKMNAAALQTLATGYVDTVRKQQLLPALKIGGGSPVDASRKAQQIMENRFPDFYEVSRGE